MLLVRLLELDWKRSSPNRKKETSKREKSETICSEKIEKQTGVLFLVMWKSECFEISSGNMQCKKVWPIPSKKKKKKKKKQNTNRI